MKLVEAYKHGQQAKADGHQRRAIPPRIPRTKCEAGGAVLAGRF